MKKALITGITGQDGSYLAKLNLHRGVEKDNLYGSFWLDKVQKAAYTICSGMHKAVCFCAIAI